MITELKPNEIFVFGSNEGGLHIGGAARQAFNDFGAEWGKCEGLAGQTYAIPTMNVVLKVLPLKKINGYVKKFLAFAEQKENKKTRFLVTAIGCGIAGYKPGQIAPFFQDAPKNVILPKEFKDCLK